MNTLTYTRFEVLRGFRNRRFFIFSMIFPLVLFLIVAGSNRNTKVLGISFPLYYMTGMIAYGTMIALMGTGARISAERSTGWTRQMKITPLPMHSYFSAKILSGYAISAVSVILLAIAGTAYGVRLSAGAWATLVALLIVGLIPFAIIGIILGHLLTPEAIGPALGGLSALFALLGGAWFPLTTSGFLFTLVKLLPSYWLVQAGKTALGGSGWPLEGWLVIIVWSLVGIRLAFWVYRRDGARVS